MRGCDSELTAKGKTIKRLSTPNSTSVPRPFFSEIQSGFEPVSESVCSCWFEEMQAPALVHSHLVTQFESVTTVVLHFQAAFQRALSVEDTPARQFPLKRPDNGWEVRESTI